jgi:hypothetical protein
MIATVWKTLNIANGQQSIARSNGGRAAKREVRK